MAIETVNARYEGFIFDGENSRDYGVYVTDVEVFGAPTRDVEMISIPGRDGEYALDKGRFNNIGVVYTCAFGTGTQSDFNAGISALRNWLASRKGYKRLEDEINAGEYRMAVFKDGLDVSTLNKETGTFKVNFDCQPQRFLKSGEEGVTVASGDAVTNPTLFDAKPLLKALGSGAITINGEEIVINNDPIGEVQLGGGGSYKNSLTYHFDESLFLAGDVITVPSYRREYSVNMVKPYGSGSLTDFGQVSEMTAASYFFETSGKYAAKFMVESDASAFRVGTAQTDTAVIEGVLSYKDYGGNAYSATVTITQSVIYDGAGAIRFTSAITNSIGSTDFTTKTVAGNAPIFYGTSNKPPLGSTIYLDLDIGEAYIIENGTLVSADNFVEIPAELPVLVPGANAVAFDSTIQSLELVPRWWVV